MIRCLLAIFCFIGWPSAVNAADYVLLHAGQVLAVPGESVLNDQSIVIRDGRIDRVVDGFIPESALELGPDDNLRTYDLREYFVLPGLIDAHTHITGEYGPNSKLEWLEVSDPMRAIMGSVFARRTLEAGFTTIRNQGLTADIIVALRDGIDQGMLVGPRIYAAAGAASATGGHGDMHGLRQELLDAIPNPGICDGPSDCRRAIREIIHRGADHIKITATGGVLSDTEAGTGQQFFDDELEAIMDTAHYLGRRVAAHAHGADGINAALRAGVDTIEHGTYADEESFALFKEHDAYLVPTMLAAFTIVEMATPDDTFMPPAIRAKALAVGPQITQMVRNAHRAGVNIAFGTDSGVSRHGENAREFALLVNAGLSPMEAIETATVNGAENLGESAVLGSLEPGKYADLIAVDGSPLTDINQLMDVDFVMKGGVAYKTPEETE